MPFDLGPFWLCYLGLVPLKIICHFLLCIRWCCPERSEARVSSLRSRREERRSQRLSSKVAPADNTRVVVVQQMNRDCSEEEQEEEVLKKKKKKSKSKSKKATAKPTAADYDMMYGPLKR